ncbi:9251_t:CDS:2 [Paraglomus occultum]|uniref:9251_t:CDS:1 n=1 Tax=Paraglomus occultum TaxID=144539 RepID=A0A9N8YXM6_9GLOM|nr:9251_t:CDS:2 [Paraglomus occultum]
MSAFAISASKPIIGTLEYEGEILSVDFTLPEYHRDGSLRLAKYAYYAHTPESTVWRNDKELINLGEGYKILKVKYCGICSTDLSRRWLPYPLPQITGHEVVGFYRSKPVVIEINASHKARGIADGTRIPCAFCSSGLETHCPDRITLGINQLPGGLSPYVIVPKNAIKYVPENLSLMAAVLTEPFAAALHAVETTPPKEGNEVAVLGPRKLGMLVLAALHAYKSKHKLNFTTTAIFRKPNTPHKLISLAKKLGAETDFSSTMRERKFDLLFDTSGSPDGFLRANDLSRGILHLKSTHGQQVCGLKRMADFVVDELALIRFSEDNLSFSWPNEVTRRRNHNILVSSSVAGEICHKIEKTGRNVFVMTPDEAVIFVDNWMSQLREGGKVDDDQLLLSPVPRFDLAVIGQLEELDQIVRPIEGQETTILRPRGAILYAPTSNIETNALTKALVEDNITIWSTRCGDLARALEALSSDTELAAVLEKQMITHKVNLRDLANGFEIASSTADSDNPVIKVVVDVDVDS